MVAVADSGAAEIAALADPSAGCMAEAMAAAPAAAAAEGLDELLGMDLDGVVIATPSALHAEQAIRALEAGAAVFCQKPLGRTAAETGAVVDAARAADRRLGVDFSYRHTEGLRRLHRLLRRGELGRVYAADLVFHNAYGPGKPWFYDASQSGGGCVMDLGIHLVDALLWLLDFPAVEQVTSRLFTGGAAWPAAAGAVEDYASVHLDLAGGTAARLACSWKLPAGIDAEIAITLYGTEGGARFRNVGGSFYDFALERLTGTTTEMLVEPPDNWGGRAAVEWATRLGHDASFDPAVGQAVAVAAVLDRIYGITSD
jgi:predicted dehydrogenase